MKKKSKKKKKSINKNGNKSNDNITCIIPFCKENCLLPVSQALFCFEHDQGFKSFIKNDIEITPQYEYILENNEKERQEFVLETIKLYIDEEIRNHQN